MLKNYYKDRGGDFNQTLDSMMAWPNA